MFSDFIKEYSVADKEAWNEAVKKYKKYDVFYLNEYVSAFMQENEENGEPVLIVYNNGEDYAINVVFRRDIEKAELFRNKIESGKYYDLISPYGYGGFIGQISDYSVLNRAYKEYCEKTGYISEFVRFELYGDYCEHFEGEIETRTHNVVRNLEMPIDEIWMDFKQKVRKNVKRAIKNNLEIVLDETGALLDDFLNVYYGTMERTQAEGKFFFSRSFFEIINQMKGHFIYFHVKKDNIVISTELVIYGTDTCYSYLGGTNSEYFDLRPNDFLKYEVIKWANNKGLKKFVLGGGYGSDDGIFQYKTCLAPNGIVDFYIGRRILNDRLYEKLVQLRKKLSDRELNEKYFPLYRS